MFKVDKEKCVGCGACLSVCPVEAISMDGDKAVIKNQCVDCGRCVQVCPQGAIQPGAGSSREFNPSQGQMFPGSDFGTGRVGGQGRGMGRGMGKGLGRGPRDGRGGGRGGGGRRG